MIQDDSKPSWLIPLERLTELWEHSSSSASRPSAALEEPLQRAGPVPVRARGPGRPFNVRVPPAVEKIQVSDRLPRRELHLKVQHLQCATEMN
ncbi:hypothetical protein Q5P01_002114 [Channa striata]|uniref:Uncharacterized protein n=1 Tax=Channa striata TaxID=64152 RepID=A0AA88NLX0_CHASR|nr:hypothetical protein Q5P01_002114 [Channa striata]